MRINRASKFLITLVAVLTLSSVLNIAATKESYSESYPAVVCPPTLAGLNSQISLYSTRTQFQRLQNRTTKTAQVKVLRLPVAKDSLLLNAENSTPVVWQSRSGKWAGAALCSSPASSQWFVGGTADITTSGRLIIINSGLGNAVVDLEVFTERGKQPNRAVNISSKSYAVISIDTLAPGDKTLAIHVLPRFGRINAYVIDEQGKGLKSLGGDLINPMSMASKLLIIPAIPNQNSKNSPPLAHLLRVLTPGDIDTNITVEVISSDGIFIPVGFNSREIFAGQVTEMSFAPKISSSVMAIRITSSEPIVASVKSRVKSGTGSDFVWSTPAKELTTMRVALTGLTPLITFVGEKIDLSINVALVNGKVINKKVQGSDITSWRAPKSARSIEIVKVNAGTYAGALASSINGYAYFPIESGSQLTKIEIPDSNIRVLNP
jgi:hypothetical protein